MFKDTGDEYNNQPANQQERSVVYPIVSLLLYIGAVVVVYVAGKNTGDVYRMKLTPPGYFFSIWGVIFSLVGTVLIILVFRRRWTDNTHMCMWAVNVLVAGWILATASSMSGKVYLMFALLAALVVCVFDVWRRIREEDYPEKWRYLAVSNIFAFYLGWVSAASVLNFMMVLIYGFKLSQDSGPYVFYPLAAIVIIAIVTSATKIKGLNSFVGYFVSAGWAILGVTIAVANPKNDYPA
mgnify:CR=1 FL=1